MDVTKFLILFYKEQYYVFGICPCCKKIFQLSDCNISIKNKKISLPELSNIIKEQYKLDQEEGKLDSLQELFYEKQENYHFKKEEYQSVEPIIEKKVKMEGRKQAIKRIKKIDKVFMKRDIDPRDIRLLFSPVEFIVFPGMTDNEGFKEISFFSKRPTCIKEEKVSSSIKNSIKRGNLEFTLIRIDDNGKVSYER